MNKAKPKSKKIRIYKTRPHSGWEYTDVAKDMKEVLWRMGANGKGNYVGIERAIVVRNPKSDIYKYGIYTLPKRLI